MEDGKGKPIFVTLKGKPREVTVPGVGRMRVTKHKVAGGHSSVELTLIEPENLDGNPPEGVSCPCKAVG